MNTTVIGLDIAKQTFHLLKIPSNLKNFLAWFAFEQIAYQLVSELEPELL